MTEARTLSEILTEIMLAIALAQSDPKEREAMLAIMRNDGWLPKEEAA